MNQTLMTKNNDTARTNIKGIYALSPMQKGMLYHTILDEDAESRSYLEQNIISIDGYINIELMEKSFNLLIERYDILRTVYIYKKISNPMQAVLKKRISHIGYHDVSNMAESEITSFLEDFKERDQENGFDLSKDVLVRISIIKTGESTYKLFWSSHHIIMDGWCTGLIFKEFFEIYESLKENRPVALGKVYPYSDFIKWLERQDSEEASLYWEKYLAGYEEKATLPKNDTQKRLGRYEQQEVKFAIDEDLTKSLREIASKTNVTLNTIIQTLWGILLQKYNNTDDVVFGAVVSGRPHEIPGVESMVGLFINTVPVRVQCDGNKLFTELLKEVQQAAVQGDRFSYYPLAEIQSRTVLKQELIDNIMVFENFPLEEEVKDSNAKSGAKSDFSINDFESYQQTNYDLNVIIVPGKQLYIKFMFNELMYNRSTVENTKEHFKTALKSIADNPELPVKDINILTEAERKSIIIDFNNTKVDYPKDKTLQELFEEQAEQVPDHTAVVFEDQQLTYRELNEKANQLARVLRDRGVGPESIVGIMVERSLEMIVGILGVLKAGGAYLPIDTEYPLERINYILKDSKATLLLTKGSMDIVKESGIEKIDLGDRGLYTGSNSNLEAVNSPNHLACVMYTSGTTGNPKGNLTTHYNIVRVVRNTNYIDITGKDVLLQLSNYAFDGATFDIYGALLNGATLVLIRREMVIDLLNLPDLIKNARISVLFITTALFNTIVDLKVECFQNVRKVLFGGERVSLKHVEKAFDVLGKERIIHVYGPTESTVYATAYPVDEINVELGTVPIGSPISNTQIFILGRGGNLQPIGIPGELCISGDGLARGYLNRPELTAEKFTENPFISGERMYRTGDLARWLPDGNIEFLGRLDHQVKVRGFRIELGEIESQLLKHPQVKETLVVAKEDPQGNQYLCAYLVGEMPLTIAQLREHLAQNLPEYMIPSHMIQLERLPLTMNGKIDRKALSEPDGSINTGVFVAPENDFEIRLAKIWEKILGVKQVGINDNFFSLGGHSLNAMTLDSEMYREFGMVIPLTAIFKYPTISAMIQYMLKADFNSDFKVILLNGRKDKNLFLFPAGGSFGIMYMAMAAEIKNHSCYAFDFIENDNRIKEYARMICEIQKTGPYTLFGFCAGGNLAFEVANELTKMGLEVSDLILLDSERRMKKMGIEEKDLKEEVKDLTSQIINGFEIKTTVNEWEAMEKMASQKIEAYLKYVCNMVNYGVINANIHLINASVEHETSEGIKEHEALIDSRRRRWSGCTTKSFNMYQGYGTHTEMIRKLQNVEVIRDIIDD